MAMCNISITRQINYMSMKWKVHFDESFFLIQENVTISKIAKKFIIEHRRVLTVGCLSLGIAHC